MSHFLFSVSEESTRQAWGTAETALLVRLGIVLVLSVLIFGRLADVRWRRLAEANELEGRVSEALEARWGLAWAATTWVPFLPFLPITLELRGQVTHPEARERVVQAVLALIASYPSRVRLKDRVWVDPA
jgi:hypothetical protein